MYNIIKESLLGLQLTVIHIIQKPKHLDRNFRKSWKSTWVTNISFVAQLLATGEHFPPSDTVSCWCAKSSCDSVHSKVLLRINLTGRISLTAQLHRSPAVMLESKHRVKDELKMIPE